MFGKTAPTSACNCFSCSLAAEAAKPKPQTPPAVNLNNPPLDQYLNMSVIRKDENGNYVLPVVASPQSVLYKYKTVMCKSWLLSKSCPYEERCKFAHGESELRQMVQPEVSDPKQHPKYKTKHCKNFTLAGLCPFGSRCLFIHPVVAPTEPLPQQVIVQAPPQIQEMPKSSEQDSSLC
ncbi:hypothetical protein M3Y97_00489100 [Aphelenchoides bicaudatus]|nr:hypothetical protein M3Y97_00489100 [Aphelenchoides bicaudatus]